MAWKQRGAQDWMKKIGEDSAAIRIEQAINDEEAQRAKQEANEEAIAEEAFDPKQIIELCRISIDWLAGIAMPTIFRYHFPKILLAAWALLTQTVHKVNDFSQIALGIPRGHAKTTVIKLLILYCVLFTQKRFILVICSTAQLAENLLADVEDMLNESNVIRLFGDWKLGREMNRQELKKFGFRGRNIILAAIGAEGSLRGLNLKNERPDVMIFEDIQTAECAESKIQSESLERWMLGTAMKAKSPHGCTFIFCGNMYPGPNSILKRLKLNKMWIKFISGAILADGTALWEELRPLQSLIDEFNNDIEAGHPEIFFSEVLNDTEAGSNSRVDLTQIRAWPYTKEELPQGRFIVIDPANNKEGGDDVTIGLFEVYDGTPCLTKLIEGNLSPGNTIRKALLLALHSGTRLIAVESVAYQSSLLYWFGVIADQLDLTGFYFVEVHSGSISKNARITTTLKSLTAGEILLHPAVRTQVIHQITHWNPLKKRNDDGILDVLGYGPKVLEHYAHAITMEYDPVAMEAAMSTVLSTEEASCF